jgi:hypothetical protein
MLNVICPQFVNAYDETKVGWPIYDLLHSPAAIAALRKMNDDAGDGDGSDTISWKHGVALKRALNLTGQLLKSWQAFRPRPAGPAITAVATRGSTIVLAFQRRLKNLKVRRISDVRTSGRTFREVVEAMATAVAAISRLKGGPSATPMLGSKVLHFVFPEFFPVWDGAWIRNKCLAKEPCYRSFHEHYQDELEEPEAEYAAYVHLMIEGLNNSVDYDKAVAACLDGASMPSCVANWLYDDLGTFVFEICLLGRHCAGL